MENGVFISYRREQGFVARAIKQHLEEYGYNCFLDVESLSQGCFGERIFAEIAKRRHFLLLVSKGVFVPSRGEIDWVLEEVKVAIRAERNIVPLFLEEGGSEELTRVEDSELAPLRTMNGLRLDHAYFLQAMEKLRTAFLPNSAREEENKKLAEAYVNEAFALHKRDTSPESLRQQLALLDQAVKLAPRDAAIPDFRAIINFRLGRNEHALLDIGTCIEMRYKTGESYRTRGLFRYSWKEYLLAADDYSKCLEIDPRDAEALGGRGECHQAMENFELAIEDYSRVLEIVPDNARIRGFKGRLLAKLGNLPEALADLTASIESGHKDILVFMDCGKLLDQLGRDREALAVYEQTARLLESRPTVGDLISMCRILHRKAAIHLRLQEPSAAVEDLSHAIEQMEKHVADFYPFWDFYQTRAKAWRSLGKHWNARQDEEKARQLEETIRENAREKRGAWQ